MSKSKSSDFMSPREIDVYELLSKNVGRKQAAGILRITIHCINKHVENAKNRNNLYEVLAVYSKGIELGYLPPVIPLRRCIGFDKSTNSKIFEPVASPCPYCGKV